MALSSDGSKLYVALNGANKLGVIDTANDTVHQTRSPSATRRVRWCSPPTATIAYVSNEGGRPANSD